MYHALPYTLLQAQRLGVTVRPSTNPTKKLDVYLEGHKVCSIGATGFMDYPHYLLEGRLIAEQKRRAYKARHQADRTRVGTAGWYADQLLW